MKNFTPTLFFGLLWFAATWATANPLPAYELQLRIDPAKHRLHNTVTLQVDSSFFPEGKLELLLAKNTDIFSIKAGATPIRVEKEPAGEELEMLRITIVDPETSELRLTLRYTLRIPEDHPINRITPEWIELNIDSFWLPMLSSFPNFTYQLELDLDDRYQVLTGDIKTVDGGQVTITNRLPRVDISFCAAPRFYTAQGTYTRVFAAKPSAPVDSIVRYADRALGFLEEYIDQPADFAHQRILVVSPRVEVGYARKNYVVLSSVDEVVPRELSAFLAHEFSHYWFSGALLSSQHHWLTESFAEYLSNIYVREAFGETAFEEEMADKRRRTEDDDQPLAAYEGRPSYLALYHKGPLVLRAFEEQIGRAAFQTLLNEFVDRGVTTNEELFDLVESTLGSDALASLQKLRARI